MQNVPSQEAIIDLVAEPSVTREDNYSELERLNDLFTEAFKTEGYHAYATFELNLNAIYTDVLHGTLVMRPALLKGMKHDTTGKDERVAYVDIVTFSNLLEAMLLTKRNITAQVVRALAQASYVQKDPSPIGKLLAAKRARLAEQKHDRT